MRRIIAFDLGANMAFAASHPSGIAQTGHETFKGDRKTRAGATLLWVHKVLREQKAINWHPTQIDAVFYERPFARGMDATRSLWGLAGLVEAQATNAALPVVDMPPGTIKSWATGKGHATKEEMIAAAQIMGYTGTNEHEADAFLGLQYALAEVQFPG